MREALMLMFDQSNWEIVRFLIYIGILFTYWPTWAGIALAVLVWRTR